MVLLPVMALLVIRFLQATENLSSQWILKTGFLLLSIFHKLQHFYWRSICWIYKICTSSKKPIEFFCTCKVADIWAAVIWIFFYCVVLLRHIKAVIVSLFFIADGFVNFISYYGKYLWIMLLSIYVLHMAVSF